MTDWYMVEQMLHNAKAMHYDGCHKIYLSMDEGQVEQMRGYGYTVVPPAIGLLRKWYDDSCALRFVSAVFSPGDNDNFVSLIPQQ